MSTVNPASIKASTPSYSNSTLNIHTWYPLFVQEVCSSNFLRGHNKASHILDTTGNIPNE